jgi:hypothetical protein
MTVTCERDFPWLTLDRAYQETSDGKPAFLPWDSLVDNQKSQYQVGYALGNGPLGPGFYSFECKHAYKITEDNLHSITDHLRAEIRTANLMFRRVKLDELETDLELSHCMLAHVRARLQARGPYVDLDPEFVVELGGFDIPFTMAELSAAGQSGAATDEAKTQKTRHALVWFRKPSYREKRSQNHHRSHLTFEEWLFRCRVNNRYR